MSDAAVTVLKSVGVERAVDDHQTRTRAHEITARIRAALLDGELGEGRINEVQLANLLAVSRTPVRAALQTLAGEGLLDHAPNKGFAVRAFDLKEIGDAYEMRALSEGLVCRLAAERGLSADQRTRVVTSLQNGDRLLSGDYSMAERRSRYSIVNAQFHDTLREAAGSRLMIDVLKLCSRVPQIMAQHVVAFDLDDVRDRHAGHHAIFRAVSLGEPRRAEQLMREHVLHVKHSFVCAAIAPKASVVTGGPDGADEGRAEVG